MFICPRNEDQPAAGDREPGDELTTVCPGRVVRDRQERAGVEGSTVILASANAGVNRYCPVGENYRI